MRFGFATDTYDAEGEATTTPQQVSLRQVDVEAVAARFRGIVEQTPPPYSAKKIHGVPAYKLARQQKEVVLKPVQVEIKEFEILEVETDLVRFRARVASGTYMRSVAHEMGRELACGAHLQSLRRTSVAEFNLDDAHTLEELAAAAQYLTSGISPSAENHQAGTVANSRSKEELARHARGAGETHQSGSDATPRWTDESANDVSPGGTHDNSPPVVLARTRVSNEPRPVGTPETLENLFVHPRKLLPELPCVTADELTAARIRNGRTVNLPELSRARQVKVFSGQRELIAIATRVAGSLFHPKIVFSGTDT
jgi:tRNA U55 pseudouridine synthase TruB